MDDQSLLRYSRHILLDAMGVEAQEKLARSRVLVVGAGGLGAAAIPYLVSAGIGHIL
ncbi:MAG: ThiF family adenylyltransferase, partial [Burkholderiales bacterium]